MKQPAPDEICAAREAAGLTQSAAAALVHANLRSWQKWEAGERAMHPAFWELFLIKMGLGQCPSSCGEKKRRQ